MPSVTKNYSEVGWLSYISFSWLNPLMTTGVQRQVALADTPELAEEEDTLHRTRELLRLLDEEERVGHSHPLLRAVARAYWPNLLMMQVFGILQHLMGLAAPLLLKKVLVFQEAQEEHEKASLRHSPAAWGDAALNHAQMVTGFCAIAGSIALGLIALIVASQVSFYQARLSIRMGQALRGAVLARCVQGGKPRLAADYSPGAHSAGKGAPTIYNVISFDVGPNIDIIWIILAAWLFPFQFITALAVLFQEVKWAILPGVAVVLVAETVCGVLLFCDGRYRHALLAAKDNRLGHCDEAFNNIRTLQMLSWTGPFESQIIEARQEELRVKNLRLWMTKMVAALGYVLSAIVTLVTLAYFVTYYSEGSLKASVAIPVIGLVTGLIGPFAQFPTWINQYMIWCSAYDRLNQYMCLCPASCGQAAQPLASKLEGDCWEASYGELGVRKNREATVVAGFEDCTLAWGQSGQPTKAEALAPQTSIIGHASRGDLEDGHAFEEEERDVERGDIGAPLLYSEAVDATLHGLDFEVRAGELVAFVGKEGNGKSSVLNALLGEMPLVSGAIFSPAIARRVSEAKGPLPLPGSIHDGRALLQVDADGEGFAGTKSNATAFAPQEPAIYAGTLRWNILFGSRHDPRLYEEVLRACQLEVDIASMPLGDLSEVAQGGATLSGGQKARVSLARAVYRAAIDLKDDPGNCSGTLVLLDEPFSALDSTVTEEVVRALFARPHGLLTRAAVVIATVDPWWLPGVNGISNPDVRVAVLREGRLAATGSVEELLSSGAEFTELGLLADRAGAAASVKADKNPQDDSDNLDESGGDSDGPMGKLQSARAPRKTEQSTKNASFLSTTSTCATSTEVQTAVQTDLSKEELKQGRLQQEERREEGHVKGETYAAYLGAIGYYTLGATLSALCGIMVFQELTTLWIAYWTTDEASRHEHFLHPYVRIAFGTIPSGHYWLMWVYSGLLVVFIASTFAGHILEIIGGIRAAREFFKRALLGTLGRPFRWWDTNPTGRVLNRFSEDVEVMDNAITNIIGVITGAVLYFAGHVLILAIANKFSLVLLPVIAILFEWIARYYRKTIREVHRLYLVSMSTVYQGMVEAILGSTTVRAFAASQRVVCQSLDSLDVFMRVSFIKAAIGSWVGLRMALVGYTLSIATTLYPVFQYFGLLSPQSAALVGFSITYSNGISGIIQQFIMNFSDLEMQLVSIERLREYADGRDDGKSRGSPGGTGNFQSCGLEFRNVKVTYRDGLRPALEDISIAFATGESCAIVGRTGAGKSSLLLSVLQLVPYTGQIAIDGQLLGRLDPKEVRNRLVGVVPQQPVIFNGNLRWNLDPNNEKSSMEIWCALEAVGLRQAILQGGRGLETPLGLLPGALALSQGQRQLLCAARVLLRQPRVAMLDEVSACLPADVATSITSSLLERFTEEDASVLLVTHQPHIAAACDRIVTLAGGCIVGDRRSLAAAQ